MYQDMKKVGSSVARILKNLKKEIRLGYSGEMIEKLACRLMEEEGVNSSTLGYQVGDKIFPSSICVSLNEELTHGIPDKRIFKEGDLVSIDVACYLKNKNNQTFHADAALTVIVGESNEKLNNLLKITKNSLYHAINNIKPNITTTQDIGAMIENYVNSFGCYVIKRYGGHGIGEKLHQEPFIPNYRTSEKGVVIKKGMFICIEPLVQFEDDEIIDIIKPFNNWNVVVSKNNHLNAHFEHTIYIGENKAEIITDYDN